MTLVLDLPPGLEDRLRERAAACGETAEQSAVRLLTTALQPATGEDILALFQPAWESVPAEEWDRLPHDLAENHDAYLYGKPVEAP